MAVAAGESLLDHFAALSDPRQAWKVVYPLPEVLLLVLCGTLAGAEDFVEIRRWGVVHRAFLERFLPYARGIPSHDTLGDVVAALDGASFSACFTSWVEGLRDAEPDIVAVDGKTSRRTHDRGNGRDPLHLVSAWASRQRLVLGQQACEAKSNEIAAIPLLLERLALAGALVTIDAMGCQTEIARTVLDRGADYLGQSFRFALCSRSSGTGRTCTARSSASSPIRPRPAWTATRTSKASTAASRRAATRSAAT